MNKQDNYNLLHWDCRESAKNYVNIASVLSGFAFTAIILSIEKEAFNDESLSFFKDQSSISFLLGFFGTMVASFTFSVISGEGKLCARTYSVMSIAAAGFALSSITIAWGLIPLIKIYSGGAIISIASNIFIMISFFAVLNMSLVQVDIVYIFKEDVQKMNQIVTYILIIIIPFVPLIISLILRKIANHANVLDVNSLSIFSTTTMSLVIGGGILSTVAGNFKENFTLNLYQGITFNTVHSLPISFLIYYLP